METITIKIKNPKVLSLIRNLEEMNLLEIITAKNKPSGIKLSERLSGSISTEQAEIMHKELRQMRDEWER
jgi:hypothetical protein